MDDYSMYVPKVHYELIPIKNLVSNQEYQRVAKARSGSREFASAQGVDLIDLVDLASRINTDEAQDLAISLLSAVKYNNTVVACSNGRDSVVSSSVFI